MTRQETSIYRDRLRALAARLGGTVAALEEGVRKPTSGQSAGGLSNAPIHLGDVGTDAFHQELDATLLENEAFIRDEVAAALDRLKHGTYGRCEGCGRDILAERLDTLPYVRHCTPCASRLQSGRVVNLNDGRPEGWLGAPGREGRTGAGQRVMDNTLDDAHNAGTPAGGSSRGGLAGVKVGRGSPVGAKLVHVMGSGKIDADSRSQVGDDDSPGTFSARSGEAASGTSTNKRSQGGKSSPRRTAKASGQSKSKKRRSR